MKLQINYDSTFKSNLQKIIDNDLSVDEIELSTTSVPYYDYPNYDQSQEMVRREGLLGEVAKALRENTSIHTVHIRSSMALVTWQAWTETFVKNQTIQKITFLSIYQQSAVLFATALESNSSLKHIIIGRDEDKICEPLFFKTLQKNRSILLLEYGNAESPRIKALLDYNQYQQELTEKKNNNVFGFFATNAPLTNEIIEKTICHLQTELDYINFVNFDKNRLIRLEGLKFYHSLVKHSIPSRDAFFNTIQRFPEVMNKSNDVCSQIFKRIAINDESSASENKLVLKN